MKSNISYRKVNIKIAQNEQDFAADISLPKGRCLGVHIVPIKNQNPETLVEVGVQDSQSSDVLTPTDFRDYKHKGGGYFEGVKQLNFPTENNRFFVNVRAEEQLTKNFVAQLIFTIDTSIEE